MKPLVAAPVIGIPLHLRAAGTAKRDPIMAQQGAAYFRAVLAAGGVPIAIPITGDAVALRAAFEMCDGILIGGGRDIAPSLYGQHKRPGVTLTRETLDVDRAEKQLVNWCVDEGVPLLGICRGLQMINVACSGTLYHDLKGQGATKQNHRVKDFGKLPHYITVHTKSRLHGVTGVRRVKVNSLHHQGIQILGRGLSVSAVSDDGIIEGVEVDGHRFALGVQSHPEALTRFRWARNLFSAFVSESAAYSRERSGQVLGATGTDGPLL